MVSELESVSEMESVSVGSRDCVGLSEEESDSDMVWD